MNQDTFTLIPFCVASLGSYFGNFLADASIVMVVSQPRSYQVEDDGKDTVINQTQYSVLFQCHLSPGLKELQTLFILPLCVHIECT